MFKKTRGSPTKHLIQLSKSENVERLNSRGVRNVHLAFFTASGEQELTRAHFSRVQWNVAGALKEPESRCYGFSDLIAESCARVVLITSTHADPNASQINSTIPTSFKSGTLMNGEIENPYIDVIFRQCDTVIIFFPPIISVPLKSETPPLLFPFPSKAITSHFKHILIIALTNPGLGIN